MKNNRFFSRKRNNETVSSEAQTAQQETLETEVTGQATSEHGTEEIQTKGLVFGEAIEALKMGMKVTRPGWNGKGMYLELQRPAPSQKMTLPYIYMFTADENLVPWLASQTDMLSEDWEILID